MNVPNRFTYRENPGQLRRGRWSVNRYRTSYRQACGLGYAKFDVEYEDIDGFDFNTDKGVNSLEFVKAICARRGVVVDVSELEAVPLKYSPEGYTERQILGFIGALYGKFAGIDRYGKLTFRWYENAERTVDADLYYSGAMTKAANDFTVRWLKCYASPLEETLICGDEAAEQGIYFECPWMDQERLEVIWEKLKNFTYRPITELKFFGDPRIDPGDMITLVDLAGSAHSVPVMSITHEYDGGITTEISAPGQSATEKTEGPIKRETKRIYSQIIKKQNEIELSIRSIDGNKIVSIINMTETEILIKASKIKLEGLVTANSNFKILEDGSIEAVNAKISGAITAKSGTIGDCVIENGVLKVKAANITGTLTASQIDATDLKVSAANITGTLTADKIKVYSSSGALLFSAEDSAVSIAGWQTDGNSIYKTSGSWGSGTFMCTGSTGNISIGGSPAISGWAFGAGGKFGVTTSGRLWCSDIQATGGAIGGWNIGTDRLSALDENGYQVEISPRGVLAWVNGAKSVVTWEKIAQVVMDALKEG